MKKTRKVLTLVIAILMIMQVFLPTISQAVETVKLNIQFERPYEDDDGDGTAANDIYTLIRQTIQTIFKIGEQDADGKLSFNSAYYCLRGGLGFGSEEEIVAAGVDYTKIADLSDKETVMNYFKDTIEYDIPEANYNAICWIAENMYLPKSEFAEDLKNDLLTDAGITNSKLTDDDIEVIQQIALWYFTNYDENSKENSVSLPSTIELENLLRISGNEPDYNNDDASYNKTRAGQITKLYKYFIDNATTEIEASIPEKMELDKTLEPTIERKTVSNSNAYVVGPFKINEIQKGNIEYTFSYALKYKTNTEQADWQELQIDNTNVYLSDAIGSALDRSKNLQDMIAGDEFYITILNISNISDFDISINYNSYYYKTNATLWVAEADDQPVLKVEKEQIPNPGTDNVIVHKEEEPEKEFDLALRKFITATNGTTNADRIPEIYLEKLADGTSTTAKYEHSKEPIYLKRGDTILYTIRVYNEGELDGYAIEVTDYLCDDLEFVTDSEINTKYGWVPSQDGKTIKTNYLKDTLIKAYDPTMTQELVDRDDLWQKSVDGTDGLYYADLQIECKIKDDATVGITLPNVAEISEDLSVGETDTPDRDSEPQNLTEDEIRNYENNPWIEDDDDYERVIIEPDKVFDLALRKYITKIGATEVTNTREPVIDVTALDNGSKKTAEYNHRKDPVEVKTGDLVTYKLTVYNEGEVAGRATKIVDQLPTGLEFVEVVSGNYELESYDEEANKVTLKETANNTNLEAKVEGRQPSSTTVEIVCKVTAKVEETDQILTNVAWISEDYNAENEKITDRDSKPGTTPDVNKDNMSDYTGNNNKQDLTDSNNYYKGQEDDDDFEKLVLKGKNFDLALRKYISNIERKGANVEFTSRVPEVDTRSLQGNETTAKYIHPKNALTVKQGDIITYKLRVYNEGDLDGYVTEITDYIPEGLGFLLGYKGNEAWRIKSENVNTQPLVGEEGWYKTEEDAKTEGLLANEDLSNITIVTGKDNLLEITDSYSLKDELIKKYGSEAEEGELYQQSINDENDGLFYQEIEVTCIVLAPNTCEDILVNIAEISGDRAVDETGTEVNVSDRDSQPNNVDLTDYELREENSTYQQDDDDYEPVQLKYFDLALRKFITGVNKTEVDTRIPEFYIDEEGNYKYRHDKTPVEVTDNDNVTYTIRVYNEGTIAGYAEEIEDDIPEGLIFLPDDETNKEYGWKMYYYDEEGNLVETKNVEEAEVIRTDYLSEAKGTIDEETGKNSNLLEVFDKETMEEPDHRDIKVVFKVSQKDIPEDNEDRIIVNKAQITDDSDDDEDSIPDKWNEGEDDQDKEYIYVQEFDLALFKWVTQTIVTVDGKTTTTETGFKPNVGKTEATGEEYRDNSEEEPVASVTIDKKKLKSTVVKFVYNIKVVNEGDIAGYATEITDYVPQGLKFVAEDNPLWTLSEEGKITTRALETKLLNPGESAEVPVVFTWINDANNLGLKKNIAAITEDYNDYKGVEDIDSVPGNEDIPNYDKEQEDDDDFALVILTLKTGKNMTYIGIIMLCITIISAGAILIKKYVL
ncbi:MAG: Cys-Gln thioester bond-forming surface protein [Clostridia bacterium]